MEDLVPRDRIGDLGVEMHRRTGSTQLCLLRGTSAAVQIKMSIFHLLNSRVHTEDIAQSYADDMVWLMCLPRT